MYLYRVRFSIYRVRFVEFHQPGSESHKWLGKSGSPYEI